MARDDFSADVVRKLGERVGFLCSNPDCRASTKGPHSDVSKTVNVGVACHIHAASSGGPRFDEGQSPTQRASIENGIWLCSTCSTKIDRDPAKYTAATLRAWRYVAELEAEQGLGKPRGSATASSASTFRISEDAAAVLTYLAKSYVKAGFPNHHVWNFNLSGTVANELHALELIRPMGIGRGHPWLLSDVGKNWVMKNRDGIPGAPDLGDTEG